MNLTSISHYLHDAFLRAEAVDQIRQFRQINLEEAYAIQGLLVARRYQQGSSYRGIKMGFTSKAKMEQMGVSELIWGKLTDDMEIKPDGIIDIDNFIHPRVEPEIAFKLGRNINLDSNMSDWRSAVSSVTIAIEVIDSRYKNFSFSLEDVIADNCSSAAYCLGDWQENLEALDDWDMKIYLDDQLATEGNSRAILGDPWESLNEAVKITKKYGHPLKAGDIILAGAAAPASFIGKAEQVSLQVEGWNPLNFRVRQ